MTRSCIARVFTGIAFLLSIFLGAATPAWATPITLVANTVNMFRDTRGINDVGIGQGDRFQFGADIQGGSSGSTLTGIYPALPAQTSFTVAPFPCQPLTVDANFCGRTVGFNSNRISSPWTLRFQNGADSLDVTGPALNINSSAILNPVPFPVSVSITQGATATTPTISWVIPNNFVPDGFRVNIYDRSGASLPSGQKDVIHSVAINPGDTSYTIPATLSAGGSLDASGTHTYSINFQVIETRDGLNFSNNNAQILRRSSSFFVFSPDSASGPPNVHLPQVGPDVDPNDNLGPVYQFSVQNVGPDSVTFIDPFVAVGYDYAVGAGDPNFASVVLPSVGDDIFDLIVGSIHNTVLAGQQFFFGSGGVSAFSVRDIEVSAALDPDNVNAFITGLTFVSAGNFTGTMTPVVQFVPDATVPLPGSISLVALALAGLGLSRRRQKSVQS